MRPSRPPIGDPSEELRRRDFWLWVVVLALAGLGAFAAYQLR